MAIIQDAMGNPDPGQLGATPQSQNVSPSTASPVNGPMSTPSISTAVMPGPAGVAQLGQPQAWGVTSDQTVEGRLSSIMNANNPIIQMARSQAMQTANGRGLLNSSMAGQAGEAAAFQSAMPIAQQDASTAAKAASYNADEANQFGIKNADALNARGMQGLQTNTQIQLQGMQGETQRDVTAMQGQTSKDIAGIQAQTQLTTQGMQGQTQRDVSQLNADSQQRVTQLQGQNQQAVQEMQNQNQALLQTNSQAASAFNQALVSMTNINSNDKMDANAKTQAIAQIQSSLQSQLKTLSATSGLGLEQTLNFSNYPGFDSTGNFVGFDAAGSTAGPQSGGISPNSAATGDFPANVNGKTVDWDAQFSNPFNGQNQPSLRSQYQQYAQGAGASALPPGQWYAQQYGQAA
jgi:hypothetical protein